MKRYKTLWAVALAAVLVLSGLGLTACQQQPAAPLETKIRYGLNTSEDVVLHSGADLVMYSDDHSTVTFTVDGATGAMDSESSLDMTTLNIVAPTAIATATPAALINSTGVSALLELRKASTPVFQVNGAGNVDAEGTGNFAGAITGQSSLDIATGAIIAAPTAQATAVPALEVDSLGVSALIEARKANTPVWQVANDGDVSNPAGTLILADSVAVDGQEDAVQLTVQGNATQTNNPLVVEQSDGTDVFTVSNAGAIVVASTSDLKGNVSDSGGTFTVADDALIDGAADAIQLTVQGYATQTSALMAVEESGGTDVATIKQSPSADSGATVSLLELAGANPINTTGTQALEALTIDLSVGDSSGGSNTLRAIGIDNITDDDQVVSEAIWFGGGYDIDLSAATDGLDMGVGSTVTAIVNKWPTADANTTSSLLELQSTSPVDTTGTNVHNALTVDVAVGNASGGTNSVRAVQIDAITGDDEVTETAINVDSGWDTDIQTAGGIVIGGTSDLQGNIVDSGGALTVADDFTVSGGVVTVPVGTEHIGLPSIISVPITYTAAAGGSGVVATVGMGEVWLVHEVWIEVTESFAADGDDATLIVGDSNDTDGFLSLNDAALQAAYSAGTGWAPGYYGLKDGEQGAYVADGSMFVYNGAETIDWAVAEGSGTTLSAGEATIYVRYTLISSAN